MAQPTTDPIAVEFSGLPDEARAPGGERGGSLEFVNALLKRWRLVAGLPLLAILRVLGGIWGAKSAADSLDRGVRKLRRRVSARVDIQTYLVYLSVTTRYPDLSAAVASRFIEYLNEFNATKRESQARARRQFVEQRIVDGERELHAAEDDLRRFHERNRAWQESPELSAAEGRLRRQVDIYQEVYLTLRRDYEQARIEEVNDTPVLTVVDPAVPPQKSSRSRLVLVLLALAFGGVIGVVGALGGSHLDRVRREEPDGYRELTTLLQRLRREVARPFSRSPRRGPRP